MEEEINWVECPKCGDDETLQQEDWIYDYGYTIRLCEACDTTYLVYWRTEAYRIVVPEE